MAQSSASVAPETSLLSVLSNRNFLGLILANTIFATAFPIQLIVGGLAGLMLAPSASFATLPASIQTLAALVAAAPISLFMGRAGRRAGFALGGVLTCLGAAAAVYALVLSHFVVLCFAHFLMGAGWSAFQYFRFAAGEAAPTRWRPVAISLMLTSGLVAAIVGPQVFIETRDTLSPIPFVGAYIAVGAVALLGFVPLVLVRLQRPSRAPRKPVQSKSLALAALRRPAIQQAIGIAATAQGIMVFLMIPTPIAMVACGFSDGLASDVVRWHIVAMFAPSFVTGFLIQRFGARRIALMGLCIIIAAAAGAATGLTAAHFYGALIVLGLGWNFAFIGATTLLDAAVTDDEKAAVQGANDTIIALISTLCAFAAGYVVSIFGWAVLATLSAGTVLVTLGILWALNRRSLAAA